MHDPEVLNNDQLGCRLIKILLPSETHETHTFQLAYAPEVQGRQRKPLLSHDNMDKFPKNQVFLRTLSMHFLLTFHQAGSESNGWAHCSAAPASTPESPAATGKVGEVVDLLISV